MSANLVEHTHKVTKKDRQNILNQKSPVIWLTGLSGSGKSTIANELAIKLHQEGKLTYILDGDNVRMGLNKDLGFSDNERKENIRRIAEVAKLLSDAGVIVITAFISPFRKEREEAKNIIGKDNFKEVFIDASLDVCERRDPKGLYKKARAGEIPMFTGIDSPYEEPLDDYLLINTVDKNPEECAKFINEKITTEKDTPKEINNLDKKNTISIDFDGVIHKYSKGFQGLDNAYDTPMKWGDRGH